MHNSFVRPGGIWGLLSILLSSEMATFDLRQYQSINGDLGGTWTPASVLILGGSGLRVTGPFVALDADVTFTSGRAATFNSGAHLDAQPGSIASFAGTLNLAGAGHVQGGATFTIDNAGAVTVANGGTTTWASGSHLTMNGGSTANLSGAVNVKAGSNVTIEGLGTVTFNSTADLTAAVGASVHLHGTTTADGTQNISGTTSLGGNTTIPSGATLVCANGSALTAAVSAPWQLNNITTINGTINVALGATCTIQSSGTFTTQAGASVNRGADEARTCAVILSGAGAYTDLRQVTGSATDHTYTLTAQDVIEVPNLGAATVYTFNNATKHARCTINRWESAGTNQLQIQRADGSAICTFPGVAGNGCATIYWNGTRIIAEHVSGAVTVP